MAKQQCAEPAVDGVQLRRDRATRACRKANDGRMSLNASQMVAVLMTDLVGSTAMADRVGPEALAHLAAELQHAGVPARCRTLATRALAIARAGGDPAVLAHTISVASFAISTPDTLQERLALDDELADLVRALEDPRLGFRAASKMAIDALQAGDRSRFESSLDALRASVASLPDPINAWLRLMWEGCSALAQGELESSERWVFQMFEAGTASGQPDAASTFGSSLFNVRSQQGRSGELIEQLIEAARGIESSAAWRAAAAIALIDGGRTDEARELALAEDFGSMPWDWIWLVAAFAWADVCSRLDLTEAAAELYLLLTPFSGHLAVAGAFVSGSIDWALGVLAMTMKRYETAEGHFAAAAEIEERFGAPVSRAHPRQLGPRAHRSRSARRSRPRTAPTRAGRGNGPPSGRGTCRPRSRRVSHRACSGQPIAKPS